MFIETYEWKDRTNTDDDGYRVPILLNCNNVAEFKAYGNDQTFAYFSLESIQGSRDFKLLDEPLKVIAAKIVALQPNVGNKADNWDGIAS